MQTVYNDEQFSIHRRTKGSLVQPHSVVENEELRTTLSEDSIVVRNVLPAILSTIEGHTRNIYVDNYQSDDDETTFDTSRPGAYAIRREANATDPDDEPSHHPNIDEIHDNSNVEKATNKKHCLHNCWIICFLLSLIFGVCATVLAIHLLLVSTPDRKMCGKANLSSSFDPFLSCDCFHVIQGMNDDVRLKYEFIKNTIEGRHYDTNCTSTNIAIWWVASKMNGGDTHNNLKSIRQKVALVSLFRALGGTNWSMNVNWLSNETECSWYGVKCSPGREIVVDLLLSNNNLYGVIESSVGLLSDLTSMDLSKNYLSGSIPLEIWSLPYLSKFFKCHEYLIPFV
jgi:hypothetical protein